MRDLFSLDGKTVVVAGGAGLLGTAVCEACSDYGAHVVIADTATHRGKELADRLGDDVWFREADLTILSDVEALFEDVLESYSTLDVVVNCAYPQNENYGANYEDVQFKDWQENLSLNFDSAFAIAQRASLIMRNQPEGGNIIQFASIYGVQAPDFDVYRGTDMTSPVEYAAIKGGIVNFTRYLASYLGGDDVRVNTISPGGVFDDQHPQFVEQYESNTPLGRMAKPEDIKGAVLFLASEAGAYVTGHNLVVDGGWTVK